MRKALGLPDGPTFYSLKRLGNSYALAHGANVSIQAARMGHSSPRMALTAYRDVLRAEHRTVADLFDRSARRIRSGKGSARSRREGHK
jgi:integrase